MNDREERLFTTIYACLDELKTLRREKPKDSPVVEWVNETSLIFNSREEAEDIIEKVNTCMTEYREVNVADLKCMLGLEPTNIDSAYGWKSLKLTVKLLLSKQGYIVKLPRTQSLD